MYKILLGIFFLLFSPSFSYAGQYVFTHYSSKDGLSSNYIHDIAQDRNGFIWIATHFGISRFNGTTFHNFLSTDYPSMYRDDIYHAFVMKHGAVTFGSSKGTIVSYNNRQDNFTDYAPTDSFYHDITGYTLCLDGEELVSTSAGVYTYCENAGKLQFLPVVPKGTAVYEVFKDRWQHYWLGLNRGVALYNRTGEKVNGFEALERINEQINNICQLDKNTLLLCSTTGSLWRVTCTEDGQIQELKKIDTPFKNISEICTDNADIWIGTSGSGLWKGICQNGTFSFERCMPINRDDSDVRKISALYKDADGNIWVGTQNTGLWCITPARQSAVTISSSLGIPMVTGTSFYENSRKEILLGTDGQGLFLLDSLYNIKQHLTDNERLSANSILSITPFNDKCVLSYWGGEISQLDPVFLQNKKLPFLGIDHPSQTAKFATTAPNGEIWACMSGDGVYVHKAGKGWSKLHLMNDKWVNHVCFSKQAAWVTTTRTIWRIDKDGQCTALFPDTEKEPTHNPTELHQCAVDEQGNCYAATSNGIYHCPANGNRFEKLGFLPQGVYCSILYDPDGQFWTSGTNGILTFKAKEQTYCHELDALSGYDQNFYIPRAIYKDHHNQFYFGTKQGFVVLNNSIKNTPTSPYTEWSELYSRGTKVSVNSSGLLPVSLSSTHQLELAYNQTDIGLKYDIVNLKANNPIKAFYRINGLDTTWVPVGSDQTIKITHLPEGDYLLEVQLFSKGRQLPNSRLQMGILVSPPWWRTWWFYTLLALSIAASALLYFRRHIRNITRQKKELEQKVAERTLELSEANLSLQQREKEVELQNELLHNALKEKDQLVSIVGHDLKNPMFSIVSTLEHLLRDKEEKDNPLLRQVYHAAAVLQGQLLKLLDWANENRITATCDIRQTDINEILAEVSAQARGMLEDKKINLSTLTDVTHYVLADPRMLSTIIRNLLTNAIKFSPEGSPILLKAVETDELVRVSVCDKGIGMSEDTIEKLRNGMRTTSLGTSSEKGYGLGFGIIREFVKQNKGTLNIKSAPGEGTTIEIDFLRTEQTLEKKANHLPEAPKPAIEADKELLAGKTILVVDDDALILLHLKTLLSEYVNVLTADNGQEGLLLAKNSIPDLILSDVDMPVMNGMEMFDALRENSQTSNIPFLFISAINEEALRIRGLARGAIDYIPKPFNEQELIMKACNVLSVLKKQQLTVLLEAMNGEVEKTVEVNPLLEQLLEVVRTHYQEPGYSFDDMANALGMSKSTLTRRLKSLTDKTPVEILAEFRLNKAKQLLLSGNATVSDVAYAVGFNDPLYFSKKFKEAFGCPPSKIK